MRRPLILFALTVFASAASAGEIAFDQAIDITPLLHDFGGPIRSASSKEWAHLGWSTDCKDVEMRPGDALSPVLALVSFEILEDCDAREAAPDCRRSFGESVSKDSRLIMVNRPADRPTEAFKVCLTGHDLTVDSFGSAFPYDVSINGDDIVLRAR